jgi:hypothetical protein
MIFRALLPAAVHQPDEAALFVIGNQQHAIKRRTIELFVALHMVHLLPAVSVSRRVDGP